MIGPDTRWDALDDGGEASTNCRTARFCVCNARGREIDRLRRWLAGGLRHLGAGGKAAVDGGDVVMHVAGLQGELREPQRCNLLVTVWLHLSLMYWSPLRPTWRLLSVISVEPEGERQVIRLRGTQEFLTDWEAARLLLHDSVDVYMAEPHVIEDSRAAVGQLDLAEVLVRKAWRFAGYEWGRQRAAVARDQVAEAWEAELAALGESDDEAGSKASHTEQRVSDSGQELPVSFRGSDAEHSDAELQGSDAWTSSASGSSESDTSSTSSTSETPAAAAAAAPAGAAGGAAPSGRRAAVGHVELRYGLVRCYTGFAVAECSEHHGRCRLTRVLHASSLPSRRAQGRPLGLMAAWLEAAPLATSAEEHKELAKSLEKVERREARASLRERPGAAALFALERGQRDSSDSEPDAVP
jgi:hypothetical protein